MENFPIHNFLIDDESSIPFQLVELTKEGSYDTSVPHRHNYYEVFIFEEGGGEHNIDFQSFSIKSQSIHFVSPGQVHNVVRTNQSKGYVILFSRDFFPSGQSRLREFPFLNNNSEKPILNLNLQNFNILQSLIASILSEQNTSDSFGKDLIKSYLNTFLIHCKRLFSLTINTNALNNDSVSFNFKQLIEEYYLQIHNVSEYAHMLNCSEKQLSSASKKELGVSPKELIYNRIILEAKRLVLYTNHSFQEIAFFLNYQDASHFAKFFKSKTGHSPSYFRENGKKYL